MPFIQRSLEPINVSRVEVEKGIKNELECVTNHTLSNIILQLSSLSKHAEDMFTELSQEVETFTNRSRNLQGRIDKLQEKVTRLDAAGELVSIHELHLRKPYKSSTQHDQQVVSRSTIPRAILKAYSHCDPTPALDKLNPYREDGKDSVKFYTDPGYFFELWFQDIQKDIENRKTELKAKRKRRPHKPSEGRKAPRKVETKAQKFQDRKHGVEFAEYADPAKLNNQISQPRPESLEATQRRPDSVPYEQKSVRTPNGPQYTQDVSRHHTNNANNNYVAQTGNHQQPPMHHNQLSPVQMRNDRASSGSIGAARPSQPPPAPPPGHLVNAAHPHHSPARDSLPPPPPPPPLGEDEDLRRYHQPSPEITRVPTTHRPSPARQDQMDLPPPPPPPPMSPEQNLPPPPPPPPVDVAVAPPPPPPPPPPMPMTNGFDDESSSTGSGSLVSAIAAPPKLKPTPKQPAVMDDRSNLLAQIRLGTHKEHLRKVEEKEKEKSNKSTHGGVDVHSIMNRAFEMRRKVIEESEEEDGSSEDEWD
ncbi:uncharacterized protein LOC111103294 [Crassostrea virginica]|uniref:Wiskott-Aldrich syndrome protein family member n=1 Tax=Crassostrea virginica TaxID=6565 RepID=A0A8B8ANF4_CRAVI|nr:wiskott-Aldrich syndrome protein family member 2-like [Crassostrea virginica]XP_022292173.1 wiskott-Aldrich syndrome protein family member 2-like [Crassostrea virginica]